MLLKLRKTMKLNSDRIRFVGNWVLATPITSTIGKYYANKSKGFVCPDISVGMCSNPWSDRGCILLKEKDQLLDGIRGYGRENCTFDGKTGMPTLRPSWPSYEKLHRHGWITRQVAKTIIFETIYGRNIDQAWGEPPTKPEIWRRQC